MPFFKKTEAYLGIDIGAKGIRLVELHKTKNRPQLWTYGMIEEQLPIHPEISLESDVPGARRTMPAPIEREQMEKIDHFAGLLKNLLKASRATTRRATASLPVSYVFHSIITLPELSEREVVEHIRAKVAKVLPRPVEEMQIVHQVMPQNEEEKRKRNLRVLVTAAPKDIIVFYTSIFERAGVELEELETEAFALERSLVGHDTATVMIIDIGADRTNFFIVDQGLPVTHRTIQIGGRQLDNILIDRLGLPASDISQVKRDMALIDPRKIPFEPFLDFINPIIKEAAYDFEVFLSQTGNNGKKPEKIILTGGSSLIPTLRYELERAFPLKVFVGDPWARVVYQQGLKPALDEIGPRMAVAIGLALRNIV